MENSMANSVDSSLVKLAIAILDDPHGITTEAWEALVEVLELQYSPRPPPLLIQKLLGAIDGREGRVYLPEGWNE